MGRPGCCLRHFHPLTLKLCLFAFAVIVVLNVGLMILASTNYRQTTLFFGAEAFLEAEVHWADSWYPMTEAYRHARNTDHSPLYSEIFFRRHVKYQYPPTALLMLLPLDIVDESGQRWQTILNGISRLSLFAMAIWIAIIFNLVLHKEKGKTQTHRSHTDVHVRSVVIFGLAFMFEPVVCGYSLGQVQTLLNLFFAAAVWSWLKEKKATCGVLMGLMSMIKPQYILLLVWGLIRRQRQFAASFLVTCCVGLACSLLLFGAADHADYLRVLSFISRHGESYYPNQSINGLVNRALFLGPNLDWRGGSWVGSSFPPYHTVVHTVTFLSSIALILFALFWPVRTGARGGATDFLTIALTSVVASPIAWTHHYAALLPICAVVLPKLVRHKVLGWATIPYLAISYVLCANYYHATGKLASTHWNFIQSYVLFGGLMVLLLLYLLRSSEGKSKQAEKSI